MMSPSYLTQSDHLLMMSQKIFFSLSDLIPTQLRVSTQISGYFRESGELARLKGHGVADITSLTRIKEEHKSFST